MTKKAGDSDVYIEKRANLGDEFGTGKSKVNMKF